MRPALKQVVYELRRTRKKFDPQDVVDAARDPESPLHEEFEWDDAKAGEHLRVLQVWAMIHEDRASKELPAEWVDRVPEEWKVF